MKKIEFMPESIPKIKISENHRRRLSATLALMDQALSEFMRWANGGETRSVLYEEINTLAPAQRQKMTEEIAAIREMLREISETLQLSGHVLETGADIRARCSLLWADLLDVKSGPLRGYGALSEEAAAFLDARIEKLAQAALQLSDLARDKTGSNLR